MSYYDAEDEEQEYFCCILEGKSPEEAKRIARNKARKRPFFGHYELMSSDVLMVEHEFPSLTLDTRSDEERERAWGLDVQDIMDLATDRQRQVVELLYGFGTGVTRSHQEVANMLGISRNRVGHTVDELRHKVLTYGTKARRDEVLRARSVENARRATQARLARREAG